MHDVRRRTKFSILALTAVWIVCPNASSADARLTPSGVPLPIVMETAKIMPADSEAGDVFGWSVALDGETLVIGAPKDRSQPFRGSAYLFEWDDLDGWVESGKLNGDSAASSDDYGWSVDVKGDTRTRSHSRRSLALRTTTRMGSSPAGCTYTIATRAAMTAGARFNASSPQTQSPETSSATKSHWTATPSSSVRISPTQPASLRVSMRVQHTYSSGTRAAPTRGVRWRFCRPPIHPREPFSAVQSRSKGIRSSSERQTQTRPTSSSEMPAVLDYGARPRFSRQRRHPRAPNSAGRSRSMATFCSSVRTATPSPAPDPVQRTCSRGIATRPIPSGMRWRD